MEKRFYNMKELAEIIPIGVSNLYALVHSDGFPAITINRRIVIPIDAFDTIDFIGQIRTVCNIGYRQRNWMILIYLLYIGIVFCFFVCLCV